MNKKIISVILAAILTFSASSCGKKDEPYKANISKEMMNYYESDLFAQYKSNHYKFRMPEYWKGKYVVESSLHCESFYEVNSYEKDETGLLFSILEYEDDSYKRDLKGKNYTFMCYDKRFDLNYVMLFPDEVICPEEYRELYDKLNSSVNVVKATFRAEL